MFNDILKNMFIDVKNLNNILTENKTLNLNDVLVNYNIINSNNINKTMDLIKSLNNIISNVIDVFKIYLNDTDNFNAILLENFSKDITECYVKSNVSDFYNTINWKNLCYGIDEIIKNNKDFNIYKIREIDDVKQITLSLYDLINNDYYKHIDLFISNNPDSNIIINKKLLFSEYVNNYINDAMLISNKEIFTMIKNIEVIITLYHNKKETNDYEFLRIFNHAIFDMYYKIINSNTDLNISNLRISNNYIKTMIINTKIPLICENIRNYIYKHKNNLTPNTLKLFEEDTHKSVKCQLKQIIINDIDTTNINNIVFEINDIVERTFYFIKAYVLNHYEKSNDLLDFINFDFLSMCVRAVTINSAKGNNISENNQKILNNLLLFYDEHFKIIFPTKIKAIGYSQILNYKKQEIETAFKNNVSTNYFKILQKYVYATFKEINLETFTKLDKDDKKIFNKQLNKDIKLIIKDLTENTDYESDVKYHKWITDNKAILVPLVINKNIHDDVSKNPSKYFKYMLNINKKFELEKKKIYNCFPMCNSNVPSNIDIDNLTIIGLFLKSKDEDKFAINVNIKNNITSLYLKIWNNNFKMDDSIFKYKNNYIFNNSIKTDGYSATILFVNKDLNGVKINKFKTEEKEEFKYIDKLGLIEIEKGKKNNEHLEKEKIKLKEEITKLKNEYNFVYTDPGINPDILHFCDDSHTFLKYTTKQRLHQMGTIKFRKRLINLKKKNKKILEIEEKLKKLSIKTCNFKNFMKILMERKQYDLELKQYYRNVIFRKLTFWSYINKKRSEATLINNIKKTYGKTKKVLLVYGDWGRNTQMKGTISVPMIGIKRVLNKDLKVLNFDEFRTSCMNYETGTKCINAKVSIKEKDKKILQNGINVIIKGKEKTKVLHSVLVSEIQQTESDKKNKMIRKRYQNRNRHAVLNFKLIVDGYKENGERLYLFNRKNIINEKTKEFEIKTEPILIVKEKEILQLVLMDDIKKINEETSCLPKGNNTNKPQMSK